MNQKAGIYIHIPFCRTRCSYCDFATGIYEGSLAERYVKTVIAEIESAQEGIRLAFDTIYFGGGTPSMLSPDQVEQILTAVRQRFPIDDSAEVTMEMNPGTVSIETLKAFRTLGINRASFGAQSFDDHELARLGRSHSVADTLKTFADLRTAGFGNVSFDLIAGLPGQTLSRWQQNVAQALRLAPEHLSFYLLEVHEGTPLAEHIRKGIQPVPDDDLAGVMYEDMLTQALDHGYEHYEISNLALPGFRSRHNTKYWTAAPYVGFGCSAHSFDGKNRRWSNERDVRRYVELIDEGASPVVDDQVLSASAVRAEAVFLGLRVMSGINLKDYRQLFGIDLVEKYNEDLTRFTEAGLVQLDGETLRLTRAGALLSNEVFAAFV
ncbi:MAG TPA: radical SAM family heme chaperone HemW [Pyrinomonadaceae bacterium]|nr:radical SAM family heme chaperone HemW [Pyrinomonadaceae bacterium]